jgi:hypothetical protein
MSQQNLEQIFRLSLYPQVLIILQIFHFIYYWDIYLECATCRIFLEIILSPLVFFYEYLYH